MSIAQPFSASASHQAIRERDEAVAELERAREGVTVCITTFNDADVAQGALVSALEQTVAPYEVIIVDDGSDVEVVVPPEPDAYPHIPVRVVRVANRGLPSARNTGLMLAKTEGIVFLDADDRLAPEFIEYTLPHFADVDVVLVGLQEVGPHRNGRYNAGFDRPWHEVTVDLLINDYNRFFYCALMRVSLLREMGGYHPAMAGWPGVHGGFEDWDMWIGLMLRQARFAAVDEPLLLYNTGTPGSMLSRAERNREALVAEMRRHHRLDK